MVGLSDDWIMVEDRRTSEMLWPPNATNWSLNIMNICFHFNIQIVLIFRYMSGTAVYSSTPVITNSPLQFQSSPWPGTLYRGLNCKAEFLGTGITSSILNIFSSTIYFRDSLDERQELFRPHLDWRCRSNF